ncbi:MAG: hypothetical protein JXX29_24015 [Deltaproteobacteria bacterium]|nr:hypothetical protein [Deltaproteobacteria bacterium]MBN2674769.1 hypothetical protein [Deltaproteobacteria bacterium]
MRMIRPLFVLTGITAMWLVMGCGGNDFADTRHSSDGDVDDDSDSDTATGIDAQLGIGDACEASEDCFTGIICSSVTLTCQYPGTVGTFPEDAECAASIYCAIGLACASNGTCQTEGEPGTAQIGDNCDETNDCAMNYVCNDGVCDGYEVVYWEGADCEATSEDGDFVAYFDVNRETNEFYRLPFPNDGEKVNGRIDLSSHTDPGVLNDELGNLTGAYIQYMQEELDGFGTQSNIYFRFSHKPNWDSIALTENIYLVNIDPDSTDYGETTSVGYSGNTAAGMYICNNWLALKPSAGRPLEQGTTYAAIIETSVRDLSGNALKQDSGFSAMLQSSAPSGDRASSAWNAYAPLRQYISAEGINASDIAVATVFTTQRFEILPALRTQVRNEAQPVLINNNISVNTGNSGYTLYTGQVTVPFYQNGERPFFESGGGVEFDNSGNPIWVEDDEVPFALTVPNTPAPATGWPVFLYAHGTDGSELSFVNNGVAARMAQMGVAVISMLQVQHGDRRGVDPSEESAETQPGMLFYNIKNPYAAIGNNLQAAADYFQLVRLVEDFALITGEDVVFNADKMYYFGHSQGTQGQYIAAVHEPLIKGIILSGAGGYLTESILNKKQPFDMSIAVKYLLMDPNVDSAHPVLSLVQASMEQVDPVNHRSAAFKNEWPQATYPARDLFMSFGLNDSYAPESTQAALAKSLGIFMDSIPGHEVGGLADFNGYPYAGSFIVNDTEITAVGIQYFPDGDYDGHFVTFNHSDALTQWPHFVETMIADDTVAEIIAP